MRYFNYPTISERIVVLLNTTFDVGSVLELALIGVMVALLLLMLERRLRGQARFYQQGGRGRRAARIPLTGLKRWLAFGACFALLSAAFLLPVGQLISWAVRELQSPTLNLLNDTFVGYIVNSLVLGASAASVVMVIALVIAYGSRRGGVSSARLPRWMSRLVTLGYAMPGAVVAAGVLAIINPIDGAVTDFAADHLGWQGMGYLLTGTILGLVYAYVVRFMAVGFNSVDASIEKVTPTMEAAARTMGASDRRVLVRIHLPLVRSGLIAGMLLVFVDVIKELPATLLLRPFGMDTLALRAYFLSVEGWHQTASLPALMILAIGILPVLLLMRTGDRTEDHVR